jgi:hypothetical protein
VEDEMVGFTSVPTYQDDTAISAFAFDRRIRSFQRWRRCGHPSNEWRRNKFQIRCNKFPNSGNCQL